MILILIYLNLFIFPIDRAEQPLIVCPPWEPFKTKENTCANFNDVCVKKGDPDCDAFQGACKQCPALNYSILTYGEVIKLEEQIKQDIRALQINAVTIKQIQENSNKKDNLTRNLLIAEIIIIISMFVCLIIEIRFKLLTKICEKCVNKGNYKILKSRKSEREKNFKAEISENEKKLSVKDKKIIELIERPKLNKRKSITSKKKHNSETNSNDSDDSTESNERKHQTNSKNNVIEEIGTLFDQKFKSHKECMDFMKKLKKKNIVKEFPLDGSPRNIDERSRNMEIENLNDKIYVDEITKENKELKRENNERQLEEEIKKLQRDVDECKKNIEKKYQPDDRRKTKDNEHQTNSQNNVIEEIGTLFDQKFESPKECMDFMKKLKKKNIVKEFPRDGSPRNIDERSRNMEIENLNDKIYGNKMFFAKFQINGVKKIDLELSLKDSIVEIKKRICRKWSALEPHSYKIMTLKQNGRVIDNNQFCSQNLLSDISECEVDSSSNYEQIVVLQIRAKFDVPNLIQIEKNKTIAELKQIIYKFTNSKDIALLNEREELKDESSIEDCALRDDDVVTVVQRKKGKLVIRSILGDKYKSIKIKYSNTDKTSSIYHQIAKDLNCGIDFILLFFKDELLDKDKFVYECGIKWESIIKYYYLQKLNGIRLGRTIDKGYNSEVLNGWNTTTNSDLMLMKYDLNLADFKPDEETIKTLFEHQIKNPHPFILQLHGIYTDEKNLYVGFEYMNEGTLTNYLGNHPDIFDGQIRRWSKQILEYLQYIHSNGCIYIDLNPYDIFVDADNNLKMHSDAIRCFYDKNPNDKIDHMLKNKSEQLIYLAPEVRGKKAYDKRADIWSFGVIVLHMATGELPKIDLTQIRSGNLQYELPSRRSEEFKNLIDSCVKIDPDERATIDELLKHKYFQ